MKRSDDDDTETAILKASTTTRELVATYLNTVSRTVSHSVGDCMNFALNVNLSS